MDILRPVVGRFVPGRSSLQGLPRPHTGAAEAAAQNRYAALSENAEFDTIFVWLYAYSASTSMFQGAR